MRKKTFLSSGVLFMGIIVMLAAIGIVNGLWSKNLVIHGVVTTGDLNADWDCAYTNDDGLSGTAGSTGPDCRATTLEPAGDNGADPNDFNWPGFIDSSPFIRKDVGECRVRIGHTDPAIGNQWAEVQIVNAYPSYECTISLWLTNTGSIPFNVIGSQLQLAAGLPIELFDYNATAEGTQCLGVGPGTQIDPHNEGLVRCTVHVKQEAAQNTCTGTTATGGTTENPFPVVTHTCTNTPLTSYHFWIETCVAQWNEATTFALCKSSEQHEGPRGPYTIPQ